jgi:hypothetical protein
MSTHHVYQDMMTYPNAPKRKDVFRRLSAPPWRESLLNEHGRISRHKLVRDVHTGALRNTVRR